LYLVFACLFSCTALFVSISQVIGCEDRLRNDLLCVGWGVKLYTHTQSLCCCRCCALFGLAWHQVILACRSTTSTSAIARDFSGDLWGTIG